MTVERRKQEIVFIKMGHDLGNDGQTGILMAKLDGQTLLPDLAVRVAK